MAVIHEDSVGLWIAAGGWVARPTKNTRFKVGDRPKSFHFGGSTRAGVGKDATCKRGEYLEYWMTTGIMSSEHKHATQSELRRQFEWYSVHALSHR